MSGTLVAEERAQPQGQPVDEHRLGRLGAARGRPPGRRRRRSSATTAGRSRRCRAMRSSSSGSPGHAVPRNHARPSPASRRWPQAEPALAAARAAEREDQRAGHGRSPTPSVTARSRPGHERRRQRDLDGRAQAVAVEPAAQPRRSTAVATRPTAAPIERSADRAPSHPGPCRPRRATATVTAADDRRRGPTTASRTTRRGRPCPTRSAQEHDRDDRQPARRRQPPTTTTDPATTGPRRSRSPRRARRPRRPGPTRSATAPPGPTAGSSRARSAASASGASRASAVSARPSRWRPPDTAASSPDRGDRAQHRLAGQGQDHERPPPPAARRPPRRAAKAAAPGRPRRPTGSRVSSANAARTRRDHARRIVPNQDDALHPQLAPTGRRTSAGSTPKTDRIRLGLQGRRRRPVGHDPALAHDHDAREEVGGQGEVVEHGHDRRPVALVEVDQQLHDVDLVADVEVGGRLVEDEDRRRLGDRDGDEHELPLAHRQLADVAMARGGAMPTRSIAAATAAMVGRTQPGERRLVRAAGRARRPRRPASRTAAG